LLRSFGFHTSLIAFKGNRIDPIAGLKRIFGLQGVIELGKAIAKTLLLGGVGWWLIVGQLPMLWGLVRSDVHSGAAAIGAALVKTLLVLCLGLIAIAMLDVPLQRFQRQKRLRMTMQEVKDELRKSEGAPELKLAQRQRQHDVLAGSARRAVTEATLVLTNPTHFAVALRYRPDRDAAPVVVARGRGDVALAIKGLAREAAVPVLEYPQLTRAIYFTTRAGRFVPEDLFIAVATILAFVFNLDRALAEGVAQPDIDVPPAKQFDEAGRSLSAKSKSMEF
jgi:flagellar biosynthesis protein FlhB